MNIFSAFDIFSQIINRVYLINPLGENVATFERICNLMAQRFLNETLTTYLNSLIREQWFIDMKAFRKCTTHRKIIGFQVVTTRNFMEEKTTNEIYLPDDPNASSLNYALNRKIQIFCRDILLNSLTAINKMYEIMEARIRASNSIPV